MPLHTGVRTGCHYLISLSVCLSVCMKHSLFLLIAIAVRGRFPQTRDLWKRASMGERVGRVSSHDVSWWSWSPGCCGFRGVFWVGRIFPGFFFRLFFFFERTRPAASVRPPCLIYLYTTCVFCHERQRPPAQNA